MNNLVIIAPGYWICKAPPPIDHKRGWLLIPRDKGWSFNGDKARPTFTPSVREWHTWPNGEDYVNHYIITDGQVQFCSDCTHSLAGQTLPLVEWTEAEIAMHSDPEHMP